MTWSQVALGIFSFSKIHARVPTDLNWPTMPKKTVPNFGAVFFCLRSRFVHRRRLEQTVEGHSQAKKALGGCKIFMKQVSVLTRTIIVCWKHQFAGNQSTKQGAGSACLPLADFVFSARLLLRQKTLGRCNVFMKRVSCANTNDCRVLKVSVCRKPKRETVCRFNLPRNSV